MPPDRAILLMMTGAGLAQWVRLRLKASLYPPLDPNYAHPRTEEELIELVKQARAQGGQLRARGSGHLHPLEASHADEGDKNINVQLDLYTRIVDVDRERMRVTVQSGCHLGVDPQDPLSNKENSLLWQLDQRGWALPDLGGITHQTVGGFISTGSMGGTVHHNFGGSIVGIRLIDGTGKVHDLAPNPEDENDLTTNPFYAAGVSLGLLGIVSTVTFQCEERYDISGEQVTQDAEEIIEGGQLQELLERFEYNRSLWWPQEGVNKLEHWRAKRIQRYPTQEPGVGARLSRSSKRLFTQQYKRRPFSAVPRWLQSLFINPFFNFLACDDPLPYKEGNKKLVQRFLQTFLHDGVKRFTDYWYEALPMDNGFSDRHMPTVFTELFIDISRTNEVVRLLNDYFHPKDEAGRRDAEGMKRTGPYAFELYPGHSSRFWLSPAYSEDSSRHFVRLDVFWFRTPQKDEEGSFEEEDFFAQFWELLRMNHIPFRPHWGKYLPTAGSCEMAGDVMYKHYPMWPRFKEVRERMDPDGIFLNTYWKGHLGLSTPSYQAPGLATSRSSAARFVVAAMRWPRRLWMHISIRLLKLYFGLMDLVRKPRKKASRGGGAQPGRRPLASRRLATAAHG